MSLIGRFCCRSRLQRIGAFGLSLRAAALRSLTRFTQRHRYAMHRTWASGGRATSATSRRRFWAMAARTNSSWAPRGPRSRSRPSFRMRFKCANRISIFLRSRRDFSKSSVPANDRATSRAFSWMSRGILHDGSFGQHWGLSGHTWQSSLLARYRSVFLRSVERRQLGLRLTSARRQNQSQLVSPSSDRSCVASKLLRDRWRTRLQLREFDQELDLVFGPNKRFCGFLCHRSLRRIELNELPGRFGRYEGGC
jgi:hypothetical protein